MENGGAAFNRPLSTAKHLFDRRYSETFRDVYVSRGTIHSGTYPGIGVISFPPAGHTGSGPKAGGGTRRLEAAS
jgi:hypothetical protein